MHRSKYVSEQRITRRHHQDHRYVLGTNSLSRPEMFCIRKVQGVHTCLMKMSNAYAGLCPQSIKSTRAATCELQTLLHSTMHRALQLPVCLQGASNYARWQGSQQEMCSDHFWETGRRQRIPEENHVLSCYIPRFREGKQTESTHLGIRAPSCYGREHQKQFQC